MLSDTKLRTLKPRPSPYRVSDANGLCVEVRPAGSRVWRYRYAGKPSIVTVGEYPVMTLADARVERDKARALLKAGTNPADAARINRAAQAERSRINPWNPPPSPCRRRARAA